MTGWFLVVAAKAAIVAAGLMGFGYLIVDALVSRRRMDGISKWALAFPAVVAFSFVLMVVHIASRGRILSNPWLVRAVTTLVAAALLGRRLARRENRGTISKNDLVAAVAVVAAALVVWGTPVLRVVPLVPASADTRWHMGWASQLMNGEPTPSALVTGAVPNYYPWLFHSLVAFVAAFTPGGRAFHTLGPLQFVQVAAAALALFAIGRTVGRSWIAGAATALFGSMAAALPIALIERVDAVIHTPRTGGPRGTYNASYNNLAPPLPRDLGYTLLLAFTLLLIAGLLERHPALLLGAGISLGLAGLTSAEFFFAGLGVAALTIVAPGDVSRFVLGVSVLAPAIALFAVWLVPLMASYVRLGGFVNTTGVGPIILSPVGILLSWGLVTPLAIYGVVRWVPAHRVDAGARVLTALVVSAGVLVLTSSLIPRLLGPGFMILGRSTRYWPVLHLSVALFAGLGAAELIERTAAWHGVAAVGMAALLVGLALPVPVNATMEITRSGTESSPLGSALLGGRSNYLTEIGRHGRARCVVAAPGSLPLLIFSYTGYRHVAYTGLRRHTGNFARIRWRDIYRYIPSDSQRLAANRILTRGARPRAWRNVAREYDVDVVVGARADADRLQRLMSTQRTAPITTNGFAVFSVSSCRSP
ncbi:MAG: hypothetical protein M3N24_10860 [Actinomycetota bacterium]|nr:hypothetical protein [Actinomycetota bacterium]